jgi:DNA-binding MarR family transcriptional regulator
MSEFLTDAERQFLPNVIRALAGAEAIGLPALICLLEIAYSDSVSVTEIVDRTGMPQQSVSRYVSVLMGRYQSEFASSSFEPLIEQRINRTDPRKRSLHLTNAGAELARGILGQLTLQENQLVSR